MVPLNGSGPRGNDSRNSDRRPKSGDPQVDLSDAEIAVGGGDIRVLEIIEEARKVDASAGREPRRCRSVHEEGSRYRPPGYESTER